jgi:hypothetical protein
LGYRNESHGLIVEAGEETQRITQRRRERRGFAEKKREEKRREEKSGLFAAGTWFDLGWGGA